MQPAAAADLDARAGTAWLATIGFGERLQLLDTLARRFNHDLRTPLNNIVGWSQLLHKGCEDPTRVKHAAEVLTRNAGEQTQLLGRFIEDCQIVVGSLKVELDPVQIDTLIAEAVERAGTVAKRPSAGQTSGQTSGPTSGPPEGTSSAGAGDGGSMVRRLLDRLLLVCTRRAREGEAVNFRLSRETGWNRMTFATTARDADWSESDLLELRIATLTAAVLGGSLELLSDSLLTTLRLQLPSKVGD
jgi:hypothetical protein